MVNNSRPVDPNFGVVTMQVPLELWSSFTTQGKIAFICHQLIDFMANPTFHATNLKAVRFEIRERGILMANEVPVHLGEKLIREVGRV